MAFCKSCGAAIEWHKTTAGKNIPIDPEPHPEGNVAFERGLAVVTKPGSKPKMYRAHWSTCPNADQHRSSARPACDREGCDRTDNHRHCYRCGGTDHFANVCEEERDGD